MTEKRVEVDYTMKQTSDFNSAKLITNKLLNFMYSCSNDLELSRRLVSIAH